MLTTNALAAAAATAATATATAALGGSGPTGTGTGAPHTTPSIITPEEYVRVRGHAHMAPLFIRRPYIPFYSKVLNFAYKSVSYSCIFVGLHLACLLPGFIGVRVKRIMVLRSEKRRLVEEEQTRLIAEMPLRTRDQFLADAALVNRASSFLLPWQQDRYRALLR